MKYVFLFGMNPNAPSFRPTGINFVLLQQAANQAVTGETFSQMVSSGSSVDGDSDLTLTQERYNAAEAFRRAQGQTAWPLQTTFTSNSASAPSLTSSLTSPTVAITANFSPRRPPTDAPPSTMSDKSRKNSYTPRDKRLSNGPQASPADKYPDDSPSRARHPPRFPAVMRPHHPRYHIQDLQQPPELHVEDTVLWPTLGEASKQTMSSRRRAAQTASTLRAIRRSSASTSGSESAVNQQLFSEPVDSAALSPGDRGVIEAQVEAYRQRLLQQQTPTRARPNQQQRSTEQMTPVHERVSARPTPTPYSAYQQRLAQQGLSQQYNQQYTEQQLRELRQEMAPARPPFVQESLAELMAAQQQPKQAPPFPNLGPGNNSTYNFDRLAASQQAQRGATVAQLHSAFFEPQSTYTQPAPAANIGLQVYNPQNDALVDFSSVQGHSSETPTATPSFYQPTAFGIDPDLQSFLAQQAVSVEPFSFRKNNDQPVASVTTSGPQEYSPQTHAGATKPVLLGHTTQTDTSTTDTTATEVAFTSADYETSPPLPAVSPLRSELWNEGTPSLLAPDTHPLTSDQETGARYGIEIGGLGVSTLGTSDRTAWLASPWSASSQGHQDFHIHPRDQEKWGGWDWAMKKGWGDGGDNK